MAEQKKTVEISAVQRAKLEAIMKDPVLWAKAFVIVQDPITKKYGPWIARDYQAECLRNRDLRKVYRFGRRLGKTEIMCIEALWRCFTNKNFRALFITPYDNQAALIFRRLREIVNESPLIKAEVIKMKSSPHTVELKNGSIILGFTTGASSNQQAASVRGQRADLLLLDELD